MTDQTKAAPAPGTIITRVADGCLWVEVAGTGDGWAIDPARMPPAINEAAVLHGYKQKLTDAAALGKGATPAEKAAAIGAVYRALIGADGEPTWNRKAGDGTSGDGLLARALQEVAGLSRDAARDAVAGMDRATQAAMRGDPEVAPVIARLRDEDAARRPATTKVDTGAMLAALRGA
jgi:hypothetical protein